jgi:hypothetical protein
MSSAIKQRPARQTFKKVFICIALSFQKNEIAKNGPTPQAIGKLRITYDCYKAQPTIERISSRSFWLQRCLKFIIAANTLGEPQCSPYNVLDLPSSPDTQGKVIGFPLEEV